MTIPIAVVFIIAAVFATSVQGNTCESDDCECSLSSVEILSDLIDGRINAIIAARAAELTAATEEEFNAAIDERISAVNATIRILNATLDERIKSISTVVGAHNATISKLLRQPGELNLQYIIYIN